MNKDRENINQSRKKIDQIDKKITQLLEQRLLEAQKIGSAKKNQNLPITNRKREQEILEKISNPAIQKIYREILKQSRKLQSEL